MAALEACIPCWAVHYGDDGAVRGDDSHKAGKLLKITWQDAMARRVSDGEAGATSGTAAAADVPVCVAVGEEEAEQMTAHATTAELDLGMSRGGAYRRVSRIGHSGLSFVR
jgi:hypothetical protein